MTHDEEERRRLRIRAAMNIFDAAEVMPEAVATNDGTPEIGVMHVSSAHSEHFEAKLHEAMNALDFTGYEIAGVEYSASNTLFSAIIWGKRR